MVNYSYLEECSEQDVTLVSEVVLIYKFKVKDLSRKRIFPVPDDEQSRFRVTADLRASEDFLNPRNSGDPEESQPPALNGFPNCSTDSKMLFAKIDITEAYHCIGINDRLRNMFGIRHESTLYRY
jgi:hypothetical protein